LQWDQTGVFGKTVLPQTKEKKINRKTKKMWVKGTANHLQKETESGECTNRAPKQKRRETGTPQGKKGLPENWGTSKRE